MQVRPLREGERELFGERVRDAFVTPHDYIQIWLPNVPMEDTRGLFDVHGNLLSSLQLLWNDLWLGSKKIKMAGVTSVATPPEHRRGGHLKRLLLTVMAQERERGINVSGLYPFEFSFYRKFGYEQASAIQNISVKLPAMSAFKSKTQGRWTPRSAEDWSLFQALYNQYCVGRFGRIERPTEFSWRRSIFTMRRTKDTPLKAYTWEDADGKTRAYICYYMQPTKGGDEWSRELVVRDMAWLDEEARHEIYNFIANHDSQAEKALWDTEPNDEFFALLPDPRQAEVKLIPGYMLRLVDVERALLERSWPARETTSFSVAVHDDALDWNDNRTYRLELSQGRPEVTVVAGSEKAGLSCDVRALAQLYAGYLSPQQAVRLGKLEVRQPADLEAAQRIFSPSGQPASFMADFW